MKTILCCLILIAGLCECCHAQDVYAVDRPQIVFVTTRPCIPCVLAKVQFDKVVSSGAFSEFDIVYLDRTKDSARIRELNIPAGAPQAMIVQDKQVLHKVDGTITQEKLRNLASMKPVACVSPKVINDDDLLASEMIFTGNEVVITWDLATQYKQGYYNGTAAYGQAEHGFNAASRYFNIRYQRVTRGGQVHVVQANYDLGRDVAARTGGNTILVSPTFRFVNATQFQMTMMHEDRHRISQAHHAQDGGLMGPNGGYQILPSDYPYFRLMGWKAALRPTDEPGWLKEYFSGSFGAADNEERFPLMNKQADK